MNFLLASHVTFLPLAVIVFRIAINDWAKSVQPASNPCRPLPIAYRRWPCSACAWS
jgi:hypothetical protein